VAVIDTGICNLRSVTKALEAVGAAPLVVRSPAELEAVKATGLVLPGVGALRDCVASLRMSGLAGSVQTWIAADRPFLGVCLGMQALFEHSEEGDITGLGIFPGRVVRFPEEAMFDRDGGRLKVPHMGWSPVRQRLAHPLWHGIADETRFYFAHSYYPVPVQPELTVATADYPTAFTCAIASANIFAVQFHPEKSHLAGLQLLTNFVTWDGRA
jgi:glutamine amidotransferase